MEAEIIFESHIPNALRRALERAGDEGFVASMPALLHARANADYDGGARPEFALKGITPRVIEVDGARRPHPVCAPTVRRRKGQLCMNRATQNYQTNPRLGGPWL